MLKLLDEKLNVFKANDSPTITGGVFSLDSEVYKIGSIIYNNIEVEQINYNEFILRDSSPLAKPTLKRPVYINQDNEINMFPTSINSVFMTYIKIPTTPNWSYVVVNGYAQYNGGPSVDFELHPSEENNLVLKILQLSGLVMKDVGLYQVAAQEEMKDVQQEKQ